MTHRGRPHAEERLEEDAPPEGNTHRVSGPFAAQQNKAAVVFLAAALRLAELLGTLIIGQIEHFLSFTLVFYLQTQNTFATLRRYHQPHDPVMSEVT